MKTSEVHPQHVTEGPKHRAWRKYVLWVALLTSTCVNLILGWHAREPSMPARAAPDATAAPEDRRVSQVAMDSPIPVSLIELLADPDVFAGKRVAVRGYLSRGLEANALYLHKEDYENFLFRNGVALELPAHDGGPHDGYVFIVGVFEPVHTFGQDGMIRDVTRLEPRPSRREERDE